MLMVFFLCPEKGMNIMDTCGQESGFNRLVVVWESVCMVRWLILVTAGISRLKSVTKWLFGIDGRCGGFALMILFCI